MEATRELKERQETPDSAEALRCIPTLALSDIPRTSKAIPTGAWRRPLPLPGAG